MEADKPAAAAPSPMATEKPKIVPPASAELLQKVKQGGYVLYMRHPQTGKDKDVDMTNLDDCTKQRNLSDEGRNVARAIGKSIAAMKIPVGEVYTSQFCRAREAAELMGFKPKTIVDLNLTYDKDNALLIPQAENDKRIAAVRKIVASTPKTGPDVLIVAHKPNLEGMAKEMDPSGKGFSDIGEGEIAVFEPAETQPGFRFVGRVHATHWATWETMAAGN